MKPDSKAEIAAKRRARRAKHECRAAKWAQRVLARAERIVDAQVENEAQIRAVLMDTLKPGKASKCVLYPVVYKAFGNPGPDSLKRCALRRDIDTVLGKLYLEGVIRCGIAFEGPTPEGPRVVSMIYLRPTNDIPVDRLAASVIGPVWGGSELF